MALRDLKLVRSLVALARNSPWLFIAAGLHVIIALVMSVMVITHAKREAGETVTSIGLGSARSEPIQEVIQPPEEIDRKKIPENEVRQELVSYEEETTFVPTEDVVIEEDLYQDLGDPTGADDGADAFTGGTSIGVGSGGHYGTGAPSAFASRRAATATRTKKGRLPKGATTGTEEAVLEGLRWLLRHQNEDGSWTVSTLGAHCTEAACVEPSAELDTSFDVGMTALALLAFLGQGISTSSKIEIVDTAMGERYIAGDAVKAGIQWLRKRQKEDGSFSDGGVFELPENDTLPAMALLEASALSTGTNVLRRDAQRALDFLVATQKRTPDGAPWGFGVGSQADLDARRQRGELDDAAYAEACGELDLSITCWVVMALKSAQSCGFDVPDAALAGALAYGRDATRGRDENAPLPEDDGFAYHAARKDALGMLVRIFAGGEIGDPYLESAARELAADVPEVTKDRSSVDFYYWYFATLALNQYDGPDSPRAGSGRYWDAWNDGLVESLPPLQDRTKKKDACARGGWLQEARGNRRGRALYNTAMNVLTLEVYYRFGNVFGAAAREGAR